MSVHAVRLFHERGASGMSRDHIIPHMPWTTTPSVLSSLRRSLLAWYARNQRDLPWRRTGDPYAVWLSEMMLQQTQVATVIPYYRRFVARFPRIESLVAAELDEVLQLWAGLGYYARARNLHRAARIVVAELGGEFPRNVRGLRKLPGLGSYSAAAVASIAFGVRVAAVDGNVIRVIARLCGLREDPRLTAGRHFIEGIAERLLPMRRGGDFNQAMMELGATVCLRGQAARCEECPWRSHCVALQEDSVAEIPARRPRTPPRSETHLVAALRDGVQWLFVRRPESGLWGGLWELPTICLADSGILAGSARRDRVVDALMRLCADASDQRRLSDGLRLQGPPFCDFRHTLTHRKVRFVGVVGELQDACRVLREGAKNDTVPERRWLRIAEASSLPFSEAMRKVLAALAEYCGATHAKITPRRPRFRTGVDSR